MMFPGMDPSFLKESVGDIGVIQRAKLSETNAPVIVYTNTVFAIATWIRTFEISNSSVKVTHNEQLDSLTRIFVRVSYF